MRLSSTYLLLAGLASQALGQAVDPAAAAASSASAYAASVASSNSAVAASAASRNSAIAAGETLAATTAAAADATTAAGATAVATAATSTATGDDTLVGTWSTKSNKTLTGPGFYNPVTDTLIEPNRTGISYSFTSDGFYEEAYYRAIANPGSPECPSGIMQWQHGTYVVNSSGLILTPFAVDGRQLLSEPCNSDTASYTRYNQTETFKAYRVYTDPYHNILRLDLTQFDGSIMQPMYLVYNPPEMLPTITLNPTVAVAGATQTSNAKVRRALGLDNKQEVRFDKRHAPSSKAKRAQPVIRKTSQILNPDAWWWIGLTMTGVGGLMFFGPRTLGY